MFKENIFVKRLFKKLQDLQKDNSGAFLIEFAFVAAVLIFKVLKIMELALYLFFRYIVESAMVVGLEVAQYNTDNSAFFTGNNPVTGGSTGVDELFSSSPLMSTKSGTGSIPLGGTIPINIEDSIPEIYRGYFVLGEAFSFSAVGGAGTSVHDFEANTVISGPTTTHAERNLYAQQQYSIDYTATWDTFSPVLNVFFPTLPIHIRILYMDY